MKIFYSTVSEIFLQICQ